ncbi:hypothetical protein AXX17_AT2G02280 [Arabidopsis thaliana]|uniref:Uncharacterized protein n=1 Tax=Arabidopsis thaliana TaxID=3702 RepID=A0A178VWN0_ARATH|nr:hypothetical protein AXX17_AT2G02330 [Arabidopsis thaliana]OAP09573.1 hypothetical protein AXX17_AT2G02280 [Arabidopsis thaliana]
MNRAEAEQEEEFSEWVVVIQTSPKSPRTDASTPPNSPILQPSHRRENPTINDDDEDSVVPSTVNLWLPWRVIETTKKRLIKNSVCIFQAVERLVRWWRRLHEEKLRLLLLLLREKDQRIKELMVEIGRLNELLSSRRRVRVVRIV